MKQRPDQPIKPFQEPLILVTAAVNRIELFDNLTADKDVIMKGEVLKIESFED